MNKCKTEIGLIEIYVDVIPNISQLLMIPCPVAVLRGRGSNAPNRKPGHYAWRGWLQ